MAASAAATTNVTVTFSAPLASSSALSHNTMFFSLPACAQACATVQQAAQLCLWGSPVDEVWCFCSSSLLKPLKSTTPPKLCPECSDQDWQDTLSNYTDGCASLPPPPGAVTSTVVRTATITSLGGASKTRIIGPAAASASADPQDIVSSVRLKY